MPARTILIVEDDDGLRFGLELNLAYEGFEVLGVSTAAEALGVIRRQSVNLVLLDLMLPDACGLEALKAVRDASLQPPVVILSALAGEHERVSALRMGAVDYITKPFSLLELIERVKLRCHDAGEGSSHMSAPLFEFSVATRTMRVGEQVVRFTAKENQILQALIAHSPEALSRTDLQEQVWGEIDESRLHTVDVHLGRIRAKLRLVGLDESVVTLSKIGYLWAQPAS